MSCRDEPSNCAMAKSQFSPRKRVNDIVSDNGATIAAIGTFRCSARTSQFASCRTKQILKKWQSRRVEFGACLCYANARDILPRQSPFLTSPFRLHLLLLRSLSLAGRRGHIPRLDFAYLPNLPSKKIYFFVPRTSIPTAIVPPLDLLANRAEN